MQNNLKIFLGIVLGIAAIALGAFGYQYFKNIKNPVACTMEAKLCPDGSSVGRTGPNCEFAACPEANEIIYKNEKYGFEITLAKDWQGYVVEEQKWQGHEIDNYEKTYEGPLIIIKNQKLASEKRFQGIPIMVFTPSEWSMVSGPDATVAVSAAPIGPGKIGENQKYVFATPPRYIGFGDDLNSQEISQIYEIVKTFKAF